MPYYSSDLLIRTLKAQTAFHRRRGICIPDPKAYQAMVAHCISEAPTSINLKLVRSAFDNLFGPNEIRMIISLPGVPNIPSEIVGKEGILPGLSPCIEKISHVFHDYSLTFLFGIVNQGHLLASLVQAELVDREILDRATDASSIYWVDAVGACADEFQDSRFVTWRHEDADLLWPAIIRFCGLIEPICPAPGSLDMLIQNLNEEGIKVLRDLLRTSKPVSEEGISEIIRFFRNSRRYRRRMNTAIRFNWWTSKISRYFKNLYFEDFNEMKTDSRIDLFLADAVSGGREVQRNGW